MITGPADLSIMRYFLRQHHDLVSRSDTLTGSPQPMPYDQAAVHQTTVQIEDSMQPEGAQGESEAFLPSEQAIKIVIQCEEQADHERRRPPYRWMPKAKHQTSHQRPGRDCADTAFGAKSHIGRQMSARQNQARPGDGSIANIRSEPAPQRPLFLVSDLNIRAEPDVIAGTA